MKCSGLHKHETAHRPNFRRQSPAFILILGLALLLYAGIVQASIPEKEVLKSIRKGEVAKLETFIADGANINGVYNKGKTTLLNYAIRKQNHRAAQWLIDQGANVNIISNDKTPLMYALMTRDKMMLHQIIEAGASLDTALNDGNTALIYAARNGRMAGLRMLVENGANVEWENEKGNTALDYANRANFPELAEYLVSITEMRHYYSDLPHYTDGPHIEWMDDTTIRMFYMIYDTLVNYPIKKEKYIKVLTDTMQVAGFADDTKKYTIMKKMEVQPSVFEGVSKVLAIGDTHGHYSALAEFLKINQVVDEELNWIWGDGHVVFLGDVFDRGNEVTESLWFIYELDVQARLQGGRVHMLLGNHEVMIMINDTRYINRKYEVLSNYFIRDYADFFGLNSGLGQWLRSRNTLVKINGNLFSHAGISPVLLDRHLSIGQVNQLLRDYLAEDPETPSADAELINLVINADGPLWYRGFVLDNFGKNELTQNLVASILDFYEVNKMIIAHTEVKEMTSFFGGKVIVIDIPIRTEQAISQALLIKDGHYFKMTNKQDQIPCAFMVDGE